MPKKPHPTLNVPPFYWVIGMLVLVFLVAFVGVFSNFSFGRTSHGLVHALPCQDSDGDDPYTPGFVVVGQTTHTDECLEEGILVEMICDETGSASSVTIGCPRACIDGACR